MSRVRSITVRLSLALAAAACCANSLMAQDSSKETDCECPFAASQKTSKIGMAQSLQGLSGKCSSCDSSQTCSDSGDSTLEICACPLTEKSLGAIRALLGTKASSTKCDDCQCCDSCGCDDKSAIVSDSSKSACNSETGTCDATSDQQTELINELTDYLTSGNHTPDQVRRVLTLAFHAHHHLSASDSEQSCRESQCDSLTKMVYDAESVAADSDDTTCPAPKTGGVTRAEFDTLRLQHESMQNLIQLMQIDMQRVAEDLSMIQSQVHSVQQAQKANQSQDMRWIKPNTSGSNMPAHPMAVTAAIPSNPSTPWQSVRNPYAVASNPLTPATTQPVATGRLLPALPQQSRTPNFQAGPYQQTAALQREVNRLKRELDRLRRHSAGVRPATFQQPLPTSAPRMKTVTYYVGDMMQPPVAGATLKLMKLIKKQVAPDSWTNAHMMQITTPSISLAITQTRENHEKIKLLLEQVRDGSRSFATWGQSR